MFDVSVQGRTVLEDFDIAAETVEQSGEEVSFSAPLPVVMKEFPAVEAVDAIVVDFAAKTGRPLVCGVEVVTEK